MPDVLGDLQVSLFLATSVGGSWAGHVPNFPDSCLALLRTNCVKQGKSLKLSMTQFFSSGNGEGGNLGSFQVQNYDFEH